MSRHIVFTPATAIRDDIPTWVWEWDGKGRIQLGTLCFFAGYSGAGKSSAARWFAAHLTCGTLDGCWFGHPQKVAYLAFEEQLDKSVKPSLRAAGADLERISFPQVVQHDGNTLQFNSKDDEDIFTQALIDEGIKAVVVDPLMSSIGGKTDTTVNNQTREQLEPWARVAAGIEGIVLGLGHLTKSAQNVMTGATGSAAFVEVPRAVFGFAKDDETGDRLMSQVKNSAGYEDLAIAYRIESRAVTTDSGRSGEVGKFVIVGNTDRTVDDALRQKPRTDNEAWLHDYLTEHGRIPSKQVKKAAKQVGIPESTLKRVASRLKVNTKDRAGYQGETYWSLLISSPIERLPIHEPTEPNEPAKNLDSSYSPYSSYSLEKCTEPTSEPTEVLSSSPLSTRSANCGKCKTPYKDGSEECGWCHKTRESA